MDEIGKFNQHGYLVVRQLVPKEDISALTDIVDRIFGQWAREHRTEYMEQGLANMYSLTRLEYFRDAPGERLEFFRMIASEELTRLIETMFGDEVYFHNTQLFFNPSEQKKLPYWHRDLQYSPIEDALQANEQGRLLSLHLRIPMVAERGVELIPGTHARWDTELEHQVRLELNGHINSEDLPGAVLIELEPGDVLVFDAQMIHRGNYRLNTTRKALDLCLGRAHPFTAKYLDAGALPTQDELDRIAHPQWYEVARGVASRA